MGDFDRGVRDMYPNNEKRITESFNGFHGKLVKPVVDDFNKRLEQAVVEALKVNDYHFYTREAMIDFLKHNAVKEYQPSTGNSVLKVNGKRILSWNDKVALPKIKHKDNGDIQVSSFVELKYHK